MLVINAINVNDAYNQALWAMKVRGVSAPSRNGTVRSLESPVATVYQRPLERMLFDPRRDANPFFHVMESMWMLAGRNDVDTVSRYAANMATFSDDGETLNGAYGHRWRSHFGVDQVSWAIKHLRDDPNSRRATIIMWDPKQDGALADAGGKDVPCNTTIFFRVLNGSLFMTVCCRSNDIIWGCYGANAVHMSFLHEYVANALRIPVGTYTQISNNWHVYERHYNLIEGAATEVVDPYAWGLEHVPLLGWNEGYEELSDQLDKLLDGRLPAYPMSYLGNVLIPLMAAWTAHKAGAPVSACGAAARIKDEAVREACLGWLQRRYVK